MSIYYKQIWNVLDIPKPLTPLGMSWALEYRFEKQIKLLVDSKLYNPEFERWLWEHGQLCIADIELFLNPSNWAMPIHCDGDKVSSVCKINYAYCDSPSLMKWYTPLKPVRKGSLSYENGAKASSGDLYWFEDEAEEIDSEEIAIHLVDVGSPHSVSTTTSERRCLSVNLDKVLPNGTLCTEVTFNMGVECLFKT